MTGAPKPMPQEEVGKNPGNAFLYWLLLQVFTSLHQSVLFTFQSNCFFCILSGILVVINRREAAVGLFHLGQIESPRKHYLKK